MDEFATQIDHLKILIDAVERQIFNGQTLEKLKVARSHLQDVGSKLNAVEDDLLNNDDNFDSAIDESDLCDKLREKIESLDNSLSTAMKFHAEQFKVQGNESFKNGDFEVALRHYREAIELDDKDVLYYTNSALALQKLELFDEGIEMAKKAMLLDANFLKSYIITVKCYISLDLPIDASQILDLIPSQFDSQHDVSELKHVIASNAKDIADNRFKNNDVDSAIKFYSTAIKYDENNHILYSNRSACFQSKKLWNEAKNDAIKVIDLNTLFPKGYIHLIRSMIQLNEVDRAYSVLQEARDQLESTEEWEKFSPVFRELSQKLNSIVAQKEESASRDKSRAESFKVKGNQSYQSGDYQDAIRFYSQAISVCPDEGVYYGNRAACWMMMKEYTQAAIDCKKGLEREKTPGDLDKIRMRHFDALLQMGKYEEVMAQLNLLLGDSNLSIQRNSQFNEKLSAVKSVRDNLTLAIVAVNKKEFSRAKRLSQQVHTLASADIQVLICLAKAHLGLRELEEASRISQQAINLAGKASSLTCLDAYVVRGEALAGQGLLEQACKYLAAGVQMDPDNSVISQRLKHLRRIHHELISTRKNIADAIGEKNFEQAIATCSDGLKIDRENVKIMAEMHFKRANSYFSQGKAFAKISHSSNTENVEPEFYSGYRKALQDAAASLYYDKTMMESFYLKVDLLQALNRFEDSISELESKLSEKDESLEDELKEKLKHAKLLLKRSKRKDLYALLGVTKGSDASDEEIKKGYKKSALKWHPDRHSASSDTVKKEAEAKFKDINAAFELLTDPAKRRLYDQGHDPEDIDQQLEASRQQHQNHNFGHHQRGGFPFQGNPYGFY